MKLMRAITGTVTEHYVDPEVDITPLSRSWVKSGDFAVFFVHTDDTEKLGIAHTAIFDALGATPEQGFVETGDNVATFGVEVHYTQTVDKINSLLLRVAEQIEVAPINWVSGLLRRPKALQQGVKGV